MRPTDHIDGRPRLDHDGLFAALVRAHGRQGARHDLPTPDASQERPCRCLLRRLLGSHRRRQRGPQPRLRPLRRGGSSGGRSSRYSYCSQRCRSQSEVPARLFQRHQPDRIRDAQAKRRRHGWRQAAPSPAVVSARPLFKPLGHQAASQRTVLLVPLPQSASQLEAHGVARAATAGPARPIPAGLNGRRRSTRPRSAPCMSRSFSQATSRSMPAPPWATTHHCSAGWSESAAASSRSSPMRESYEQLVRNVGGLSNVTCLRTALWSHDQSALRLWSIRRGRLYVDPPLRRRRRLRGRGARAGLPARPRTQPRFIKLDCEGAEVEILRGAERVLEARRRRRRARAQLPPDGADGPHRSRHPRLHGEPRLRHVSDRLPRSRSEGRAGRRAQAGRRARRTSTSCSPPRRRSGGAGRPGPRPPPGRRGAAAPGRRRCDCNG